MKDTYLYQGKRKKLIALLREKGISDEKVLEAMGKVPRHFFFESAFSEHAYQDKAFPIGADQTISQPFTVAYQTSLLNVNKHDKIMEIGTGSGYQATILSQLGARVFSIERQKSLFQKTSKLLSLMGYDHVRLYHKDGYKGLPEFASFDKILITAGATEIPQKLKNQLKIGGILVAPLGPSHEKTMIRMEKTSDTEFEISYYDKFQFVPLLEGIVR